MFSSRNVIILIIIVSIIAGVVLLLGRESSKPIFTPNPMSTESPDIGVIQSSLDEIPEASEVRSPDGRMKLVIASTIDGDNNIYSFSVSDASVGAKKAIFSKTVLAGNNMEISPNAWSPDNKYLFITERGTNSIDYFVLKADGESFSDDQQYIDVVPRFVAKNTGYKLSEVTGWDSETLLHVLSKKEDESRGPSFWFEIPSQAIIQLSSR